jgi:hypothetical protein
MRRRTSASFSLRLNPSVRVGEGAGHSSIRALGLETVVASDTDTRSCAGSASAWSGPAPPDIAIGWVALVAALGPFDSFGALTAVAVAGPGPIFEQALVFIEFTIPPVCRLFFTLDGTIKSTLFTAICLIDMTPKVAPSNDQIAYVGTAKFGGFRPLSVRRMIVIYIRHSRTTVFCQQRS